jgi:hypothetical protein
MYHTHRARNKGWFDRYRRQNQEEAEKKENAAQKVRAVLEKAEEVAHKARHAYEYIFGSSLRTGPSTYQHR